MLVRLLAAGVALSVAALAGGCTCCMNKPCSSSYQPCCTPRPVVAPPVAVPVQNYAPPDCNCPPR